MRLKVYLKIWSLFWYTHHPLHKPWIRIPLNSPRNPDGPLVLVEPEGKGEVYPLEVVGLKGFQMNGKQPSQAEADFLIRTMAMEPGVRFDDIERIHRRYLGNDNEVLQHFGIKTEDRWVCEDFLLFLLLLLVV